MYTKGIVEAVTLKEVREGQYGKFAGYGIKIGDEWYNGLASEDKYKKEVIVKDSNHNEITKGMEIEFMFEKNDKGYNDIDKKTLRILKAGGEKPTESREATIPPQPTTNPTPSNESLTKAVCLHTATMLAGLKLDSDKLKDITPDDIERMANVFYKKCIQ